MLVLCDMLSSEDDELEEPPAGQTASDERRRIVINRQPTIDLRSTLSGRAATVKV
jgi:hypothetical protein